MWFNIGAPSESRFSASIRKASTRLRCSLVYVLWTTGAKPARDRRSLSSCSSTSSRLTTVGYRVFGQFTKSCSVLISAWRNCKHQQSPTSTLVDQMVLISLPDGRRSRSWTFRIDAGLSGKTELQIEAGFVPTGCELDSFEP